MNTDTRVVFLGTPDFAVTILRALHKSPLTVVGVVSQPDRPVGRKRVLTPSPVKEAALALGLPVITPERIRNQDAVDTLSEWQPDFLITAAYGQIIPEKILQLPRLAALNVHASLLPKLRGASPIQSALLTDEKVTGISIMTMVKAMDAGPVWAQAELDIAPGENYGELSGRLAELGAQLLLSTLPQILDGKLIPMDQDESLVTFANRLTRADEWLDFDHSADAVCNKVRALAPAPGATVRLADQVIKLWQVAKANGEVPVGSPGQVLAVGPEGILVACNPGAIWIKRLQAAGKNVLDGLAFAHGRRDLVGKILQGNPDLGGVR